MTKTYTKTFTNKQQAHAYYNKIRMGGNLTSKAVCALGGQGLWAVYTHYTVNKWCVTHTKDVQKDAQRC